MNSEEEGAAPCAAISGHGWVDPIEPRYAGQIAQFTLFWQVLNAAFGFPGFISYKLDYQLAKSQPFLCWGIRQAGNLIRDSILDEISLISYDNLR